MKKNYSAWDIKCDEFFRLSSSNERLKFLIRFAILAPSTHNSQPWKFEIGDDYIYLKPNFERALAVSDPENRHLYISLGCALENLLIAADYYGYKTIVEYFPSERKDAAVKINFEPSVPAASTKQHLIFSIPQRRNNRSKYTALIPDHEFLEKIRQLSSNDVQVHVILDQEEKNKISDILIESAFKAFSNKAFRGEMADYKRTNFTSSSFGMPGFTMGFGNLFSLVTPFLIRNFNVMKVLGHSEEDLLKKYTPVFLLLSSKENNSLAWLHVGQIFERIMLEAQQSGVSVGIRAVPLNVAPIQQIINTQNRPQMFLRMGYATNIPGHSPRQNLWKT